MYVMCFNVSVCFKMGSLYSYCDIITSYIVVYPLELSRIAGFCINSNKIFLGEDPRPPIKQNCLSLYYNHITAIHLKKLKTQTQISPPTHHFSGEFEIIWSKYVLFEKSFVDHFFVNGCLKEQRKVLENSLKMYLKSPWKVLEKDISWSVGTMIVFVLSVCLLSTLSFNIRCITFDFWHGQVEFASDVARLASEHKYKENNW